MIIDIHAHLVTPPEVLAHKTRLLANGGFHTNRGTIPDAAIGKAADSNVALLDEVGTDMQLLSPRPFYLGTSMNPSNIVEPWIGVNNDAIARTVELHPTRFAGIAGLPITPGNPVSAAFGELSRTVEDMGFVGVLVNPDPGEGTSHGPALDDPYWYPLWEKLIELDVPALIHSAGCFSGRETYSEHFVTEESIAVLSLIRGDVFRRYPELRVIISHGGGSVPYQLGRWQAERLDPRHGGGPDTERFEVSLRNLYFDTVLHYPLALELLLKTVGSDRVLFGTERPGSGSALNPDTGADFDVLKPVIDGFDFLTDQDRTAIFEANARKVFPRLAARLDGAVA